MEKLLRKPSTHRDFTITRENSDIINHLLETGESLERILGIASRQASNAALQKVANNNSMIGSHRADFRFHINKILSKRKERKISRPRPLSEHLSLGVSAR